MLKIITKEFVKEKISSAETILDECFEMLLDFKHDRGDLGNILANFQPKLAECLYQLMQFYHELQKEKKYLISQKEKYSKQEFSTMMANNASFSKVVSQTIEIGKNLGDAYVWFFFRDNRSELDKHFQHNTTGLYVGGIGGSFDLDDYSSVKDKIVIMKSCNEGDVSGNSYVGGIVGENRADINLCYSIGDISATTTDVAWSDQVYTATMNGVEDGKKYGQLNGAYFSDATNDQVGTLQAVITMDLHDVTFDAMGGKVNGQAAQLVEDQYKVPGFKDYVPTREGGYLFAGWYKDIQGNTKWNFALDVVTTKSIASFAV